MATTGQLRCETQQRHCSWILQTLATPLQKMPARSTLKLEWCVPCKACGAPTAPPLADMAICAGGDALFPSGNAPTAPGQAILSLSPSTSLDWDKESIPGYAPWT